MNIMIIARGYPSTRYNLYGIFEFDQAKALAAQGHNVTYLALDRRSVRRWRKWGLESFTKEGVRVEAINLPYGKIPQTVKYLLSKSALSYLYGVVEKKIGKPDVIHTHFLEIGEIVGEVFANKGIPLVITEHLSSINQKAIPLNLINSGKNTYHKFDKVIAVSKPLADNIEKFFDIKADIIPNIIDTSTFAYEENLLSNDKSNEHSEEYFDFISIGGLIPRKKMDFLINAFYDVFKSKKSVRLFIYGDGPMKSSLEKLIKELKLEKQVYLKGRVERSVIAQQMVRSKCFVLASEQETFGVVYIEAMAMGLPVIATKCGGPEDFVDEENGLLIPVNDKNALSKALIIMYNNNLKYNATKIAKITEQNYSPAVIAEKLINKFETIIK